MNLELQPPPGLLAVRNDSVSQLVIESIRTAIVTQALPPGSRLTESGLASQLNVSKTPVREALITLREIGIIEPDGRRGDRVVRPSRKTLQHAYDAREALEIFLVRQAAETASTEQIERMKVAAARSLEGAHGGDATMFREGDADFHEAIRVSDNKQLNKMIDNIFTLIITLRQRDAPDKVVSIRCGEDHVAIAAAIEARNPDEAEKVIRSHIRYIAANVLANMDLADPASQ